MLHLNVHDQMAIITMANAPVNALSREWATAFNAALDELETRDDWRVLRVCSGLRLFSAGGDIKQFASRLGNPEAGAMLVEEALLYQKLFSRIERMPQLSIAEIEGVAAGGGFEIALACDLRIMSETARVGLPEVGLGLLPSAGGTQRLTRLVGVGRALRLIGGAEMMLSTEAEKLGVVEWVLPATTFAEDALAIASRFVAQPREALVAAKACIYAVVDPESDGFELEAAAPRMLMDTAETRAKITAFLSNAGNKA